MAVTAVNWGFLSTAEIATKVYLALTETPNGKPYAVASRSLEKATEWAAKHPGWTKIYGTYDELLNDPVVDAIYIPLPTAYKKEWAIKAAQKKKHILLEKPLPENIKDLEEILEACRVHGVNFMDGTMWLHSIRTGIIEKHIPQMGEIKRINAAFTFLGPSQEWLDGANGRTDPTREPQGCLECGWYPIGAILFAKKWELPERVQTLTWNKNKIGGLVYCGGCMWFKDGTWATFDTGYHAAHRCFYEVSGSEGTLFVDDLTGGQGKSGNFQAYFVNFSGSSYYKVDNKDGKESVIQTEPCNHTMLMLTHFGENVLNKTIDSKWPKISLNMQITVNAVFESYLQNGKVISLAK